MTAAGARGCRPAPRLSAAWRTMEDDDGNWRADDGHWRSPRAPKLPPKAGQPVIGSAHPAGQPLEDGHGDRRRQSKPRNPKEPGSSRQEIGSRRQERRTMLEGVGRHGACCRHERVGRHGACCRHHRCRDSPSSMQPNTKELPRMMELMTASLQRDGGDTTRTIASSRTPSSRSVIPRGPRRGSSGPPTTPTSSPGGTRA